MYPAEAFVVSARMRRKRKRVCLFLYGLDLAGVDGY